ncbi:MAG: hypothetical protein E7015_03535 [Alphaproteobacteria bacterium]|nr:hypothetical protein [Alphaproteobacteria bacterium]
MNFILRILLCAIVYIIPLNNDAYATKLDSIIVAEKGKQPELTDKLIEELNTISSKEFISELEGLISFDLPELIEKLVNNVNEGTEPDKQVNLKFLQDIANVLQKGKGNTTYAEFAQSIKELQAYGKHVMSVIEASPKKTLFSILWIDSIEEADFSETKEALVAKLESLVITYLESFTALCPKKRNTLQSITLIIRYGAISSNDEKQIREAFNEIANNTIGKLLLYRILIEAKKKPFSLYITSAPAFFNVVWDQNIYGLGLFPKLANQLNFPVFSDKIADSTVMYSENEPDLDVAIFHELVHLFHKLTSGIRSNNYASGKDTVGNSDIRRHPLFLYYYGDHKSCNINDNNWRTSLFVWNSLKPKNIGRVNFEEMLTICGLPQNSIGYSIGDELSENLYRTSKKLPLRFGHQLFTCFESETVKRKVIECIGYYYNTFKKLGEFKVLVNDSQKTKDDYDFHSSGMTRLDGMDGMYFYTIPNYISRHESGLFKNLMNRYHIRKDLSNAYYYLCPRSARSETNETS